MLSRQLEFVHQARTFLATINEHDYNQVLAPHFSGSIGAHMRHAMDHVLALQTGLEVGHIDYNKRHRLSEIEKNPDAASQKWLSLANWFEQGELDLWQTPVTIQTEIALDSAHSVKVPSQLGRELIFVISHAVHHFSFIASIRSMQGGVVPEGFGFAPATLSFLRQQA